MSLAADARAWLRCMILQLGALGIVGAACFGHRASAFLASPLVYLGGQLIFAASSIWAVVIALRSARKVTGPARSFGVASATASVLCAIVGLVPLVSAAVAWDDLSTASRVTISHSGQPVYHDSLAPAIAALAWFVAAGASLIAMLLMVGAYRPWGRAIVAWAWVTASVALAATVFFFAGSRKKPEDGSAVGWPIEAWVAIISATLAVSLAILAGLRCARAESTPSSPRESTLVAQ